MKKHLLSFLFFAFFVGNVFAQQKATATTKLNTPKLDSLFNLLEINNKSMGSLAISENGKVIYSKNIGFSDVENKVKSDPNTKYRIGSISKMFTSVLIFKAIEEKKITLDDKIETYFPTLENAKLITVSNLLNHRSGVFNFTQDENIAKFSLAPKTEKELLEMIMKNKSVFVPDSKAEYSNSNYVLLTFILEKIYKKPYKNILKEKILSPLGLKNTHYGGKINPKNNESFSYDFKEKWIKATETDMSVPLGAGALISTPTDLNKFVEALFAKQLISENSLTIMTTIKDNYGYGIFKRAIADKNGDKISFGHNGGIDEFTSILNYFPENKLSIAYTSNGSSFSNDKIVEMTFKTYSNIPFELPNFKTYELKTEDLDKYLGVYASKDFPLKITITKDNKTLIAQAEKQSSFPLDATEKDVFKFETAGIVLEFNPSKKEMTLKQRGKTFLFTKE